MTHEIEAIRQRYHRRQQIPETSLYDPLNPSRYMLPTVTKFLVGDASTLNLEENSFDIVFQSTVFTSILDPKFQQNLANRMWSMVKPGGGILWYEFTFDNPNNPDVKGVPKKQIHQLFPDGNIKTWQLSLAPPISRRVTKIDPSFYSIFNLFPFLRTHVLSWITKP